MGLELMSIVSDGVKKLLIEAIPGKISERFQYRMDLSVQLRNQPPRMIDGKVTAPVISIFVTIRNSGSKPEYLHRCGFDGSHVQGSAMSSMAEWSPPRLLEHRSLLECELRFVQDHVPEIKAVWVENALQTKWYLRKKDLANLNEQLKGVVENNYKTIASLAGVSQ